MDTLLVVLIVLCVLLFWWAPRGVVTRDPSSIAGLATILSQSPQLLRSLRNTGSSNMTSIQSRIHQYVFSSGSELRNSQPRFTVNASAMGQTKESTSASESRNELGFRWWQPISLELPARLLVLTLLIVLIVILEVLYQYSRRHDGLVNVSRSTYSHYGWTYIPAAIMVSVGALLSMVDFNARVYQPYHALRRGAVPASDSILENNMGEIALHALFSAVQRGHYAILATTSAMLLSPILTIAVSGLFTAGSYDSSVAVQQITYFNFSTADGGTFMGFPTLPVTNLLVTGNLSFPAWTFGNLVIPQITISQSDLPDDNSTMGSLRTQVPAIRGAMNCESLPGHLYRGQNVSESNGTRTLFFNISTPDGCGSSCLVDDNYYCATASIDIPPSGGYYGQLLNGGAAGGGLGGSEYRRNEEPSCPTKLAVWGSVSATDLSTLR